MQLYGYGFRCLNRLEKGIRSRGSPVTGNWSHLVWVLGTEFWSFARTPSELSDFALESFLVQQCLKASLLDETYFLSLPSGFIFPFEWLETWCSLSFTYFQAFISFLNFWNGISSNRVLNFIMEFFLYWWSWSWAGVRITRSQITTHPFLLSLNIWMTC